MERPSEYTHLQGALLRGFSSRGQGQVTPSEPEKVRHYRTVMEPSREREESEGLRELLLKVMGRGGGEGDSSSPSQNHRGFR